MDSHAAQKSQQAPVALVVGGTGGIGPAICARLAGDGLHVVLTSRNLDLARWIATELMTSVRGRATIRGESCDLADPEAANQLVERVGSKFGRLDIVVVNAGTRVVGAAEEVSADAWRQAIVTNLLGPAQLAAAAVPWLRASGRGRLVFVSSASAIRPLPTRAPYAAAKAGIAGLVRALAVELGPTGATVNAVAPGLVAAGMALASGAEDRDYFAKLIAQIPAGRAAEPTEIAAAVAYLVSLDAGYVTGQVLVVDGGFTTSAMIQTPQTYES